MTFEEVQRTVEFLVQHGAQVDARLERLLESQGTLTAATMRLTELMQEFQGSTEQQFSKADERLAELAEAQKRTDEQLRSTDKRLNALIRLFESHTTRADGGRKKKR